ncbi:hypothetical protein [Synechococcus elongatus]|uniref:DUF2530 domain-containing protein n=1 Tax=Synechococcus elongatus PCC 11802 TaxID=2283154 RepID=A0AAT9JX51_SYNEL|nr:hypothetical protein [Synechococcus elongatus]
MDWIQAAWPNPLLGILIAAAIVHCVAGLWATAIATQKGYSTPQWLVIGLIGGSFAVLWSRRLSDQNS